MKSGYPNFQKQPAPQLKLVGAKENQRFEENVQLSSTDSAGDLLSQLISQRRLTSFFQPIVCLETGSIFAYEALCRTVGSSPFESTGELFQHAMLTGQSFSLDMLCRENSILAAAALGLQTSEALLFINICPTSLLHPDHNPGSTEQFALDCNLPKERIVLEITEQEAVSNYALFKTAIDHYRECGFKIAIDDFGAGYGGLKMLSMLEPDYVKIDRHFFQNKNNSHINYNLVDAVATACHQIGIDVIAEGIENEQDLRLCQDIGIHLLQGFHFARPAPELASAEQLDIPDLPPVSASGTKQFDEVICVGDIGTFVEPAAVEDRVLDVLNRFNDCATLDSIPVLRSGQLCGLIDRRRFMESHMIGRYGYDMSLDYYKHLGDVVGDPFLQVPHYTSVEEVARKIQLRQHLSIYDDICITRSGKYMGMVSVSEILSAVTANSMILAQGANPLTGLPGNEFIQRQIAKMYSQSIHFDVCYIDIDSMKPFNNRHGYELGDRVIKKTGNILIEAVKKFDQSGIGFAGHIGGDDFIVITRPKNSIATCEYILKRFSQTRPMFHTREECQAGYYDSVDRNGRQQRFGLLSLSIGIVSPEVHRISSIAEISSIASDLKNRAKKVEGSVIVRDRREVEIITE